LFPKNKLKLSGVKLFLKVPKMAGVFVPFALRTGKEQKHSGRDTSFRLFIGGRDDMIQGN
jgi:hypothetical protein